MPVIALPTGDEPQGRLRTPKGTPICYSPLMIPSGIGTLSLLPEPHKELLMMRSLSGGDSPLHRTTSSSSTQVPDEEFFLQRTVSNSSTLVEERAGDEGDREDMVCFGLPPLNSPLGKWAQATIRAELGSHEYYVDNSALRADTLGLAFRKSKNPLDRDYEIHGPAWGSFVSGYDEGDGWLRVGRHLLPMDLLGTSVLVRKDEATMGCSALTQDGRVLDLGGGAAMHFSRSKGVARRNVLKEEHRLYRAARLAHKSCDAEACIEACEVCPVDASGTVHGALPGPVPLGRSPSVPKRVQRRLQQRRRRAVARFEDSLCRRDDGEPARLCMGGDGKVFLFLELSSGERVERRHLAARRLRQNVVCEGPAFIVDMQGVVHL